MGFREQFNYARQRLAASIAGVQSVDQQSFQQPVRAASSQAPYDAGSSGRRAANWVASRLGPNTLLIGNQQQIIARSREQIRNNPWAVSAIDKFESNVIGNGIQAHWADEAIQKLWNESVKQVDFADQCSFYGLQALVAREIFEAGEVFVRYRLLPRSKNRKIPFQIQLIESEQCPIFLNSPATPAGSGMSVRTGIEFDESGKRVAYQMYKEHPGDTMIYPSAGLSYMRLLAEDVLHVMKPLRVGQLRGQPILTPVLALLYELDQFSDATLVRQKVAAMFSAFVTKNSSEDAVMPPAANYPSTTGTELINPNVTPFPEPGIEFGLLEAGTIQSLYPGEEIVFPNLPDSSDYASFMKANLHKFAAGCHMTYEQITTDLEGVNFSSIRSGTLEFRRSCEQMQNNTVIFQFCDPFAARWLKEAILAGQITSKVDVNNLSQYMPIWIAPGWPWVDPQKDVIAQKTAVRCGFTSRTRVIRETGEDPLVIDNEQRTDMDRAEELDLMYDSDPNQPDTSRETISIAETPDGEAVLPAPPVSKPTPAKKKPANKTSKNKK